MKVIDFLDITLDLGRNTYRPFLKPNNTLLYVRSESNHPPDILKNIPESVNRRLSAIASDENQFKQSINPYQEALEKAGYTYKLKPKDHPLKTKDHPLKTKTQTQAWQTAVASTPLLTTAAAHVTNRSLA